MVGMEFRVLLVVVLGIPPAVCAELRLLVVLPGAVLLALGLIRVGDVLCESRRPWRAAAAIVAIG